MEPQTQPLCYVFFRAGDDVLQCVQSERTRAIKCHVA
jgi:hypothetical protein